MTKDETPATEATKDETPATEATKDETPAMEAAEAAETAARKADSTHSKRRSMRRRLAALAAVGSVATILTFLDDVYRLGMSIVGLFERDRSECSLSMDVLEPGTYTRDDALDGSCLTQHYPNREYAKYYEFTLEQAATVTVEMTSRDMNSWLALRSGGLPFGSANVLGEDDDGGDGVDARIKRFLAAGTYTIEATTRTAGLTGDFTLAVTVDPDVCSVSIDPLGRGSTRNDTLDDSCPTPYYPAGEYARYYEFTLNQEATVTVEMTSRDVDSWLALRSGPPPGSAEVLEENDDGGGGGDARIERVLDTGTYTIEATTLSVGETGDFTLTVTVDETEEVR